MKRLLSVILIVLFPLIMLSCGSKKQLTSEMIVYWVPAGHVYHVKKDCTTLKRSHEIDSGTIDEARAAGKYRMCKVCGKNYDDVSDASEYVQEYDSSN